MPPRRFFEQLVLSKAPGWGAAAMALAGVIWAGLCLLLAAGGHAPTATLVPIDPERYYLAQAAFVLPLLLLQWWLCSALSSRLARALGGTGSLSNTAAAMGVALATPLVALFLLPDWVVYTALGFEALGPLVRVTAPLSFVTTLWLATLAVRAAHQLSNARAFVAALAGVLTQAAVGAPWLR